MPLPFILGVLGVKKIFDASDTANTANIAIKKANDLKEEAKRKADNVQSSCNQALVRLGKKKLHVQSYSMSSFVKEFNQLKGREFVVKVAELPTCKIFASKSQMHKIYLANLIPMV
ncbi:hypothetical protein HpDR57_16960 [Helicobacter pylori]